MDPVTIIGLVASVVSLIQASNSVLKVIGSSKGGNKNLSNLSNDVTIFSEALSGFDRVLRSRHTLHHISGSAIESMLSKSAKTIKDLEGRLVQMSSSDSSTVRRARWIQNSSAVNKLHDQLKEQNVMLQAFLSITHALVPLPHIE
jgi:hypothetical protein